MQSRLARQRIHQHTRAHTRQPCRPRCAVATELGRGGGRLPPPSLPLFTSLSTCSDIIDKSQFSRLCRNSTFRFSSSFIIHPCLWFIPFFPLTSYPTLEKEKLLLEYFAERPIRRRCVKKRRLFRRSSRFSNSACFLEKSLSVFLPEETQNLHFIEFVESISRICKHDVLNVLLWYKLLFLV